ncbi:tripartite motif-containing protein 16-like [Chaetodon auriga]|uniref:tripartite motif-containing protein 16-like n=1 Tax=Chaetodon auriga TaxID=39042 RepID=UPI004032BFCD
MKLNLLQPAFLHTDMAEPHIPVRMNNLCCTVCFKILRNPVTVPCGHNFCLQCIQRCWDRDERSNSPCSCPECGHMFPSRPRLIRNTTLADLVRDTEQRDAGSESWKQTHSNGSTQAPKRARSCTETGSPLCWRHSCVLDVYCCTDEEIICAVCASSEHIGHTIGSVVGERKRKQAELKNIQMKSQQLLQKQEKKCNNLWKTLQQIEEEARKTEDSCEGILTRVIDSLQRHYLSVKELIAAQEKAAAAQVQNSLQTLQVKMQQTRKRSAQMDCLAQTDNDVHFLKKWPSLRRCWKKDNLHRLHGVSEDPLFPFELTKTAVEELGRHLEEFCDKEFAYISQTADSEEEQISGETEEDDEQQRSEARTSQSHGLPGVNNAVQNAEPKTRAEFLQYACGLSLDPATAHEDLAISHGDKQVRLSPLKLKSPTGCYPERFVYRRQLLCREGLQAERCYYEIEVEGDKAEIALAYKTIDRKSRTNLSAFGSNANSWSLDRSTHYSVSHRANSIQLMTTPNHHRIGVYLEFKKGTLSFYEVSDSMTFLYKVEAKFTEPLYPGFWLAEKCCIRICDLR